jgi:hypothetical protein
MSEPAAAPVTTSVRPTAKKSNMRARPRYGAGTVTLTRVALASTTVKYFAWVHDISETGIGLDVLGPLGAGAELIFELKSSGPEQRIRFHARVMHATRVGLFYRLGCRFIKSLQPTTMTAILKQMRGTENGGEAGPE